MKCNEIIKYLEDWAPKEIAWEKDNVGLQIGSAERKIKNIMLSLDLNENVIDQALKKNCNFIFTHHPLLFKPLTKIDASINSISILVEKLIKNDITLYSAHTNLDFTKDGVSFQLAKKLKLNNINFLANLPDKQIKLVVFVPGDSIEKVAGAIHQSGGGIIGEYSNCSYRLAGTGTFKGSEKTKPAVGGSEALEFVDEIRLEVLVDQWKIDKVISAMKLAHPYEEVAFDLYPLKNANVNYGLGAIGTLNSPMNKNEFFSYISKCLGIKNFRYSNGTNKRIKTVAVCGGSCSDYLNEALKLSADVFITADVKYHSFRDAERKILLIDAGHYETEIHSLNEVHKRLSNFISDKNRTKVFKYIGSTNPIIFYNN
jgi:dinuclear metal center YbgI/SA1388 family protein